MSLNYGDKVVGYTPQGQRFEGTYVCKRGKFAYIRAEGRTVKVTRLVPKL